MKKLIIFSLILVAMLFLTGCKTSGITNKNTNVFQIQATSEQKYQPVLIVKEFITSSGNQEWDKALKQLTKSASNTMKTNLKRNTIMDLEMQSITTHILTKGGIFSVINAEITYSKNNNTLPWMQAKQIANYNYYLRKINNEWKIYKVEPGNKEGLLPMALYPEEIKPDAKRIVSNYIKLTTLQKWQEAESLLGGDALEKANQSILPNVKLKNQIIVSNLKLLPIGSEKGIQLIEATYILDNSLKKPSEMRLLFYVVQTEEGWKINGIDFVEERV